MSISEQVLWDKLKNGRIAGFKFRRQVRVAGYFLDFYCAKAALCIEVDGGQHALRLGRDARRDREITKRGIETLRIPSLDLFDQETSMLHVWVERILHVCIERAEARSDLHPPTPSSKTNHLEEGEPGSR